jgi:hypothetical protein
MKKSGIAAEKMMNIPPCINFARNLISIFPRFFRFAPVFIGIFSIREVKR